MLYYEVFNENNCFIINDSIYFKVDHKFSMDMPNAFTPNGDGLNDTIYIKGWGIKEIVEFKVFDQFGKKVYESNDLNSSWDGTNNGKTLPVGTYYYTVTVLNYDNKTRSKQGYFHLLK